MTGAIVLTLVTVAICSIFVFHDTLPWFSPAEKMIPFCDHSSQSTIVELTGAGSKDGIYCLQKTASLKDLAVAADLGPLQSVEDHFLASGSCVIVNVKGTVSVGEMTAAKKVALGIPLDVNRATVEELTLIEGIGKKTAERIVAVRTQKGHFRKLEELMDIPGIKKGKYDKLKSRLRI
ncbi:MAG: helix-hairpin-helix domain-containing protein [Smithellaceae bacterium]|nr:helix-hairpin-helix domain-containing protein [Smithellaceae bacterium]